MTGRFKYLPPDPADSGHGRKRDYRRRNPENLGSAELETVLFVGLRFPSSLLRLVKPHPICLSIRTARPTGTSERTGRSVPVARCPARQLIGQHISRYARYDIAILC
ncbi:hypothetical protein APICC_02366 [Apis cerana cerana]|uniref:Uncharacterized protein n=1 Tax=Apis cerana cerana TaxID=94128 RepID=A0A2A3ESC1_APICC|nr:hypothetical protein APICC_02366 [Apis cerana cerana]